MPERSDDAFACSESVKHARTACTCAAVRACCCFFARPPKRERLKLRNIACVRKLLGVLLCRSQADHPTAPFEHDKRDGQAENLLLCKQCISGSSGRSPERRWPIFASLTIFDMMMSSLKMAGSVLHRRTLFTIIALSAKISQIKRRRIGENAGRLLASKLIKQKLTFVLISNTI